MQVLYILNGMTKSFDYPVVLLYLDRFVYCDHTCQVFLLWTLAPNTWAFTCSSLNPTDNS